MAKSGKSSKNLLRISGIIFTFIGVFHVSRYFGRGFFHVGSFELTYLGSLILGTFLVLLALACFKESK